MPVFTRFSPISDVVICFGVMTTVFGLMAVVAGPRYSGWSRWKALSLIGGSILVIILAAQFA